MKGTVPVHRLAVTYCLLLNHDMDMAKQCLWQRELLQETVASGIVEITERSISIPHSTLTTLFPSHPTICSCLHNADYLNMPHTLLVAYSPYKHRNRHRSLFRYWKNPIYQSSRMKFMGGHLVTQSDICWHQLRSWNTSSEDSLERISTYNGRKGPAGKHGYFTLRLACESAPCTRPYAISLLQDMDHAMAGNPRIIIVDTSRCLGQSF